MLIAFEGIDGAGKSTQAEMLKTTICKYGLRAALLKFPRYQQTLFGQSIADYLNGKFGSLNEVTPQFAALLYAGDRFQSLGLLNKLIANNHIVILDRYIASNLAHQGSKVKDNQQLISWIAEIEYNIYKMPKADITLHFDMPARFATFMIHKKEQRNYTTEKADIHEQDTIYLEKCREIYHELANKNYASSWLMINCLNSNGSMHTIPEVQENIWRLLLPYFEQIKQTQ